MSDSIFDQACEYWETLKSDSDANFDQTINIDVSKIKPQVTWGTSPEMTIDFDAEIPSQEVLMNQIMRIYCLLKPTWVSMDQSLCKI